MKTRLARTLAAVAATAGLALALTACGGNDVQFDGNASKDPVAAASEAVASATDAAQDAVASVTEGSGQEIVLPEFPVPRLPDVSSMTGSAAKVQTSISSELKLPPGVQVTGARCAADGSIVNRSGATAGFGDDGSQVASRVGTSQVGKNGAGQVASKDVVYQVGADGSGQVATPAGILQVNADRSGQYTDDSITYQVASDGSGQYTSGTETYQVEADGSGSWTNDEFGVVANNGDGTGTWTGPAGVVEVKGDGTGTLNGVTPVKVAPMPKFALLGKLPNLKKLKPLGRPCGTLIRISAGVLFDFDKDTVRPEAKKVLAAVAKALGTAKVPSIQVNGHTDAKGTDSYNQDLSERRAAAVVAELTADGLATPMDAQGFGESQPVAPNELKGQDNPVGRQLNRRVEIVVPNA